MFLILPVTIEFMHLSHFGETFVCRFMISGRVLGAVGGNSCPFETGGPSNVKINLVSMSDDVIASSFTSETGHYLFTNIIPGLSFTL